MVKCLIHNDEEKKMSLDLRLELVEGNAAGCSCHRDTASHLGV